MLNKEYNISSIATNQATSQEKDSVITKLNNNISNTIINNVINTELSENFRFSEDIELTDKEFCQLLNIVINSSMQEYDVISFIQLDISQNLNSTIQRTNIKAYALVDISFLKDNFNLNIKNNLLVVNNYIKNQNNITNNQISKTVSVNDIQFDNADSDLKSMFFESIFADIYDTVVQQLQETFNCQVQYQNNKVLIYA